MKTRRCDIHCDEFPGCGLPLPITAFGSAFEKNLRCQLCRRIFEHRFNTIARNIAKRSEADMYPINMNREARNRLFRLFTASMQESYLEAIAIGDEEVARRLPGWDREWNRIAVDFESEERKWSLLLKGKPRADSGAHNQLYAAVWMEAGKPRDVGQVVFGIANNAKVRIAIQSRNFKCIGTDLEPLRAWHLPAPKALGVEVAIKRQNRKLYGPCHQKEVLRCADIAAGLAIIESFIRDAGHKVRRLEV